MNHLSVGETWPPDLWLCEAVKSVLSHRGVNFRRDMAFWHACVWSDRNSTHGDTSTCAGSSVNEVVLRIVNVAGRQRLNPFNILFLWSTIVLVFRFKKSHVLLTQHFFVILCNSLIILRFKMTKMTTLSRNDVIRFQEFWVYFSVQ